MDFSHLRVELERKKLLDAMKEMDSTKLKVDQALADLAKIALEAGHNMEAFDFNPEPLHPPSAKKPVIFNSIPYPRNCSATNLANIAFKSDLIWQRVPVHAHIFCHTLGCMYSEGGVFSLATPDPLVDDSDEAFHLGAQFLFVYELKIENESLLLCRDCRHDEELFLKAFFTKFPKRSYKLRPDRVEYQFMNDIKISPDPAAPKTLGVIDLVPDTPPYVSK